MPWIKQHPILVLLVVVAGFALTNAIIFVPKHLNGQQNLSTDQLNHHLQQLAGIAESASQVSAKLSHAGPPDEQQLTKLDGLVDEVDGIVENLQPTPVDPDMQEPARQALQLGQIMSFSLRDLSLSVNDKVKAAKTAQVMKQAVNSANAIQDQIRELQ